MGDVIDDIGEAVGGAVEAVGNTVTEAVDWAADAAASSAEFVAASAEAAVDIGASVATGDWDGVVDAGENFGGALVDHFEDLGESVVMPRASPPTSQAKRSRRPCPRACSRRSTTPGSSMSSTR